MEPGQESRAFIPAGEEVFHDPQTEPGTDQLQALPLRTTGGDRRVPRQKQPALASPKRKTPAASRLPAKSFGT